MAVAGTVGAVREDIGVAAVQPERIFVCAGRLRVIAARAGTGIPVMWAGEHVATHLPRDAVMLEPTTLDERQERVAKCLEERGSRLAGMYRSALHLLRGKPEVGFEVARVSMICHCIRELMINLPVLILDKLEPRPDPSSGSLTRKLPRLLAEHPDLDLSADQDILPVPRAVAQAFDSLIKTAAKEDGRNTRNAAAPLAGDETAKVPVLKQWNATYGFFVSWAHLDRDSENHRDLPSDEDLLTKIRIVEDVIEVRAGVFFENVRTVRDLLDDINYTGEERS
ncbi:MULTISPECIES: hypothetical protein [unclassified Pseudonocardia]|uniref:hypothetical protein n=1 Tax=unclassified Pseudonocardia TaxID=2619320 RepID=UPI000ACB5286|nr:MULTISPECIES: hypothetical protein [unclassified Pseudonocardia]